MVQARLLYFAQPKKFLPWCKGVKLRQVSDMLSTGITATVLVGYVSCARNSRSVDDSGGKGGVAVAHPVNTTAKSASVSFMLDL